ncbi:YicC/YloC family endoribonuclease [uncultured Veillonella sp.]|uniref:YicC/YloC family endoribonuclease n=1 Tax=uncultured Veillonella sp. TaxID=159268 RepID=UPI00259AA206|nr:YicC/YloC family endoribonuclease [uncultured Veillonella sp.]
MNSMTGFGSGRAANEQLDVTIEMKSVNSRYCDIICKVPRLFTAVEDEIRRMVKGLLARGKIEVSISYKSGTKGRTLTVDSALVQEVRRALVREGFYESEQEVPLSAVTAVSNECFSVEEVDITPDTIAMLTMKAAEEAITNLLKMRAKEGEALRLDIEARLQTLENIVEAIDCHKTDVLTAYEERLRRRLDDMLSALGKTVDEDRILQEVAIMADKTDISEEIVRFGSHVVQLRNTLNDTEPIGRKLDFLIQEMNREVNTMGSKGADLSITDRVVALKCELEKIREQIQNIE